MRRARISLGRIAWVARNTRALTAVVDDAQLGLERCFGLLLGLHRSDRCALQHRTDGAGHDAAGDDRLGSDDECWTLRR